MSRKKKPNSNTIRSNAFRDRVTVAGGRRLDVSLSAEANAGLAVWRECVGAKSDTEAVELAILKAVNTRW